MSETINTERCVYSYLTSIGCCLRCRLRFLEVRTPALYEDPTSSSITLGYAVPPVLEISPRQDTCIACLGILSDNTLSDAITKIATEVNEQRYDCDKFTCALTIPIAVQLRERSMQINLSQKFGPMPAEISVGQKRMIPQIKDVWKWISLPKIEKLILKIGDFNLANCPFVIDVFMKFSHDEDECKALLTMCEDTFKVRSHQKRKYSDGVFSRKSVEAAMNNTSDEQFVEHYSCPPSLPPSNAFLEKVTCTHSSIYIGERYNKYSRELSQTPWFIAGKKKMETSVQELLADGILQFVRADSLKFLSSGREDVDVRTLKSGRPFAVELLNPRITKLTDESLAKLTEEINISTKLVHIVNNLKVLSRDQLKRLKEGEDTKTKTYTALCLCRATPVPSLDVLNNTINLEITQKTPVRVLHRRPLVPRPRTIHSMKARWISEQEMSMLINEREASEIKKEDSQLKKNVKDQSNLFLLDVTTQAGTYVKEFVHGDFGRTYPSICDVLGAEVDIVALDVTNINLEWP